MEIVETVTPLQWKQLHALFEEYGISVNFALCFQDFEAELWSLPTRYGSPAGVGLLACERKTLWGCVALRPLSHDICEMKRLYVRPACRNTGVGRQLVIRLIEEAKKRGYRAMRLETVPSSMAAAIHLYTALGFRDIAPYHANPVAGAWFMEISW